MKNPRDIKEIEAGYLYKVPVYSVKDGEITGITNNDRYGEIPFCKGDKSDNKKPRQSGIFIESLLEVCRQRLIAVNKGDLATRETSTAITKIDEAIMWLEKRSNDRKIRGVEGTYQK